MSPGIEQLRKDLSYLSHTVNKVVRQPVTSGCQALDDLLPGGGFTRGTLIEWLGEGMGNGAGFLALVAAREACREEGALVVVDTGRCFYPPAAAAWEIDLDRVLLVRPGNDKDEHWVIDQALRCSQVSAVMAWPQRIPDRIFRRWQLSAESGGCLGLFVRPVAVQTKPSWAETRLRIVSRASSCHWQLMLEILRCRRGFCKSELEIIIDEQTGKIQNFHPRHLASPMAVAASVTRPT